MNVLLIAPRNDLVHVDAEVQEVVNLLQPTTLLGTVSAVDVMRAMRRRWDLVWIASHGDEHGIKLSDSVITASDLSQFARGGSIGAIYLNTCSSAEIGATLHEDTGAVVIFTVTEVNDAQAFYTGAQLARHLADGRTLDEAYQLSKPHGNRDYRMIGGHMGGNEKLDMLIQMVQESRDETRRVIRELEDRLNQRIDDIERKVYDELGRVRAEIARGYQIKLTPRMAATWTGGFAMLVTWILLMLTDVRSLLSIEWPVAAIISFVMLTGSVALFVSGVFGFPFRSD